MAGAKGWGNSELVFNEDGVLVYEDEKNSVAGCWWWWNNNVNAVNATDRYM